jgi:hypothetical protein
VSDELFPLDLPGLKIDVQRSTNFKTDVQTAASGKELRACWWSSPRRKWTVAFEFLRQHGPMGNELDPIVQFYERHMGQFDSFLINDPVDGQQYRVRFNSDDLEISRFLDGYYEIKTLTLMEVK